MNIGELVECQPKGFSFFIGDPENNYPPGYVWFTRAEIGIVMKVSPPHRVFVLTAAGNLGWLEDKHLVLAEKIK